MKQIDPVLSDRGSKYTVSGSKSTSKTEALEFVKQLKRTKKFAKTTHNSWGLLLSDGSPIKADDGESGAGQIIIRMLERAQCFDEIIVVTRWYGGTHLGGDRFRHVQTCVNQYLEIKLDQA